MQRFNAAAEAARGVCARFFATIARRRPRALTALPFASRGPSGGSPATLRDAQARATRARIADPGADRAAARPDAARPLRTSCPGRKNDPLHGSAGRRKGRFELPRPQRDRQDERSRPSGVAHPGACAEHLSQGSSCCAPSFSRRWPTTCWSATFRKPALSTRIWDREFMLKHLQPVAGPAATI